MNIDVPITGTNYCQDVFDRWLRNGSPSLDLSLRRVVDNKHDAFAVAVDYGGYQMGWVAQAHSRRVAAELDQGRAFEKLLVVYCSPSQEPMHRMKIRLTFAEAQQPQPGTPRHIVKVFGALSQAPDRIQVLRNAQVGMIFDCLSNNERRSVSLADPRGGEVAWFRKDEPRAEIPNDLIMLANRGALVARVETQNPLTVGLFRKGDIREPETTPMNNAKAAIAAALVEARSSINSGATKSIDDSGNVIITYPNKKETTMNNLNLNAFFSRIFAINTKAASEAAYLETGRIANKTVARIVIGRLPWLARFYAKTPLGSLAIANSAIILAQQLRPGDERISKLAAAMATSAYQELIQTLDVEGMVDQLLAEPAIKRALDKADVKAGETGEQYAARTTQ